MDCTWHIPTHPYFQWLLGRRTDALDASRLFHAGWQKQRSAMTGPPWIPPRKTNCWTTEGDGPHFIPVMDFFQTWGHIYYIYHPVFLSSEKWAVAARGSSGLVINRCFLEPVPWLCPASNWWGVWEFPFVRKYPYKWQKISHQVA